VPAHHGPDPVAPEWARVGLVVDPGALAAVGPLLDGMAAVAAAAEAAGFTSLWVLEPEPGSVSGEPYSLLGALAAVTERIHLAALPRGGERRAPSVLAKIVTAVDVLSHGRAVLAVAGDAAGGPDPASLLAERLAVVRGVLAAGPATVEGRVHAVHGAVNLPSPVQHGGIPVVAAVIAPGPRGDDVLAAAASGADALVVDGGADGVAGARRAASGAGRPDLPVIAVVEPGTAPAAVGADGVLVRWAGTDPAEVAGLAPSSPTVG